MKIFKICLIVAFISLKVWGGQEGNGSGLAQLEGFRDYKAESSKLRTAIKDALKMVANVDLESSPGEFPELAYLSNEIQSSKYILVPYDVLVQPNRAPGDYPIGTYLVASTDTVRGAPTRIYPTLIKQLSPSQMVQMVIHEALHRALPKPLNGYETVVERITKIVTEYAPGTIGQNLRSYLSEVRNLKIPWLVQIDGIDRDDWQPLIQPFFDDNTFVEATIGSTTRIGISFDIGCGNLKVLVQDQYRGTQYTYLKSNIPNHRVKTNWGSYCQNDRFPEGEVRQFIRSCLEKFGQ